MMSAMPRRLRTLHPILHLYTRDQADHTAVQAEAQNAFKRSRADLSTLPNVQCRLREHAAVHCTIPGASRGTRKIGCIPLGGPGSAKGSLEHRGAASDCRLTEPFPVGV